MLRMKLPMFHSLSSSWPCPPPGVRMIECHADLNNYKFLPTVAVGPQSINTGLSSGSSKNFPGHDFCNAAASPLEIPARAAWP